MSDDLIEKVARALKEVFLKHGPFELSDWVEHEEELAQAAWNAKVTATK